MFSYLPFNFFAIFKSFNSMWILKHKKYYFYYCFIQSCFIHYMYLNSHPLLLFCPYIWYAFYLFFPLLPKEFLLGFLLLQCAVNEFSHLLFFWMFFTLASFFYVFSLVINFRRAFCSQLFKDCILWFVWVVLKIMYSKKVCWRSNCQYLRVWPFGGSRVFIELIKSKWDH